MELFKFGQELFILQLECDHKLRSNFFVFEVLDLLQCERAAVQNPTVDPAVGLNESFLNQLNDVTIWQHLLRLESVA